MIEKLKLWFALSGGQSFFSRLLRRLAPASSCAERPFAGLEPRRVRSRSRPRVYVYVYGDLIAV